MEIERIDGHTRVLALDQRQYRPLHIRDQVEGGVNYMTSQWRPTPEELAALMLGAPIFLSIAGTGHPPVLIQVGAVPASAGVMDVDGGTGPSQSVRSWTATHHRYGVMTVHDYPNKRAVQDYVSKTYWKDLSPAEIHVEPA